MANDVEYSQGNNISFTNSYHDESRVSNKENEGEKVLKESMYPQPTKTKNLARFFLGQGDEFDGKFYHTMAKNSAFFLFVFSSIFNFFKNSLLRKSNTT